MKKLLVAAVAAIAFVGSAFAVAPVVSATSNTNKATSGVFGNDTDDFMNVN